MGNDRKSSPIRTIRTKSVLPRAKTSLCTEFHQNTCRLSTRKEDRRSDGQASSGRFGNDRYNNKCVYLKSLWVLHAFVLTRNFLEPQVIGKVIHIQIIEHNLLIASYVIQLMLACSNVISKQRSKGIVLMQVRNIVQVFGIVMCAIGISQRALVSIHQPSIISKR